MNRMPISIANFSRPGKGDRVSAAINRDRRAFDELVSEYSESLRQFLARRVPPGRLDDLVQEVWLSAWTALPKFDRRSGFQTWLFSIGLNKIRDYYRKDRRMPAEVPLLENAHLMESPAYVYESESTDAVRAMVANLPEKQREVIELYYCCDYTLPEVAKMVGRNLNTVKYQFYAAHAELALELKGEKV